MQINAQAITALKAELTLARDERRKLDNDLSNSTTTNQWRYYWRGRLTQLEIVNDLIGFSK